MTVITGLVGWWGCSVLAVCFPVCLLICHHGGWAHLPTHVSVPLCGGIHALHLYFTSMPEWHCLHWITLVFTCLYGVPLPALGMETAENWCLFVGHFTLKLITLTLRRLRRARGTQTPKVCLWHVALGRVFEDKLCFTCLEGLTPRGTYS